MNEKTIDRNELVLTQDFYESFQDASFASQASIIVEEGDGECCSIRFFDEKKDDCGDFAFFLLSKEDAERFAQAILIHSGARKVA